MSDMNFSSTILFFVDYIVLTSGILSIFWYCTGTVFVADTLEVMRSFLYMVSKMPLLWGCCVEGGGDPVEYNTSAFCWIKFVLLLTAALSPPSYQRTRLFHTCTLSVFAVSMCPGLFLVNYLLLCLHRPCDQQYDKGIGRRWTYMFFCRRCRRCCCWSWIWWRPI